MREFIKAIRLTFALWGVTAILYPLVLLMIGQTAFNFQANGSLMTNQQGQIIGSALIGQRFTTDRYFWSRPSAINYSSFSPQERDQKNLGQITGISGASNLAPSSPDLLKQVGERVKALNTANFKPTIDLVYSSGSGLDPHITVETAKAQIQRIATARSLNPNQIEMLISNNTERRFLGIFGEPGVNVLKLNLALDKFS